MLPTNLAQTLQFLGDDDLETLRASVEIELARRRPISAGLVTRKASADQPSIPARTPRSRQGAADSVTSIPAGRISLIRASSHAGMKPAAIARTLRVSMSAVNEVLSTEPKTRPGAAIRASSDGFLIGDDRRVCDFPAPVLVSVGCDLAEDLEACIAQIPLPLDPVVYIWFRRTRLRFIAIRYSAINCIIAMKSRLAIVAAAPDHSPQNVTSPLVTPASAFLNHTQYKIRFLYWVIVGRNLSRCACLISMPVWTVRRSAG
jgi:hypothetical protein